jgi:hypothetical protein
MRTSGSAQLAAECVAEGANCPILVPLPGPCAGHFLMVRAALQRLCLASQSPGPCPDLHCSLGVAVEAKARQPQIQLGHLALLSSSSPFSHPRRPISLAPKAPGIGRRSFSLDISWEAAPRSPPSPPRHLTSCISVLHVPVACRRPPALSTSAALNCDHLRLELAF